MYVKVHVCEMHIMQFNQAVLNDHSCIMWGDIRQNNVISWGKLLTESET